MYEIGIKVATFNDEMLHGFAEEDRDTLRKNLQRIIANLTDAAGEMGDRFKRLPVQLDF